LNIQFFCQALGLLEDEKHLDDTLVEAALFHSASHLRELFVIMIFFCHIPNLNGLWNKRKENMTADILQQHRRFLNDRELRITPQILNKTLIYFRSNHLL